MITLLALFTLKLTSMTVHVWLWLSFVIASCFPPPTRAWKTGWRFPAWLKLPHDQHLDADINSKKLEKMRQPWVCVFICMMPLWMSQGWYYCFCSPPGICTHSFDLHTLNASAFVCSLPWPDVDSWHAPVLKISHLYFVLLFCLTILSVMQFVRCFDIER